MNKPNTQPTQDTFELGLRKTKNDCSSMVKLVSWSLMPLWLLMVTLAEVHLDKISTC